MQDKLTILLNQMDFPQSERTHFEGGSIERILCSQKNIEYCFEITLEQLLPPNIAQLFLTKIKEAFPNIKKVEATFHIKNINTETIIEYYYYFLEQYAEETPSLAILRDYQAEYQNNILTVVVGNRIEQMKLEELEPKIIENFSKLGIQISMIINVNSEINNEIEQEIEACKMAAINEELCNQPEPVPVEEPKKKFIPKDFKRKPLIQEPDNPEVIMGTMIETIATELRQIATPVSNVTIEGYIFGTEIRETRTDLKIITLKITDYTDSIYGKIFVNDEEEFKTISKQLKTGKWFKFKGSVKDDNYSKEQTFMIRDINVLKKEIEKRMDDAEIKRVELHAHTFMSQMDGVVDETKLVKQAMEWGHKAIAITDHNGVQAFPHVYHLVRDYNKGKEEHEKFKALYGTELTMINDEVRIVIRPNDSIMLQNTYVVFDFETTGFNAGGGDTIIEIGAVKILNGEIIDKFDELINPGRPLPAKITEVTSITDDMLKDKDNEENAIKRFIEWYGDLPMVAHNAKFDVSFLEMAHQKYNLGEFTNTVIDTLELSRTMDNSYARHSLSALVKRYDVPFDEESHHRGDYDAEATAYVFHKMMRKLEGMNFEKISDLDKLVSKDEIHKYGRPFHVNLIAQNKTGLKNLFKIISLANTKYLYKTPRILRSEIERLREGILVGSGCYESEVFTEGRSKSDEELSNIIKFYDYVEVQPPEVYDHLLQMNDFGSEAELISHLKKIIRVTEEAGKLAVATGDVHHLNREDKIYRNIIVNQKVPGGGRHPLARNNIKEIPCQHFRTTREMVEDFSFLDDETIKRIVIDNPNKIADMCEIIEVIIETGGVPFSPKIEKSVETVTELVYTRASEWYGEVLPENIEERIATELYGDGVFKIIKENLKKEGNLNEAEFKKEAFKRLHDIILKGFEPIKDLIREHLKSEGETEELEKKVKKNLGGIIGGGFDVIYLIAQKLVKHSNDDGYLVGSRGSVGSSFVATMMGITEVNPLPAHYRCLKCKHSIFEDDDHNALGATYSSGFDLPDKTCPKCGEPLFKDGQDMPFATFLGFNADKVPDIDLNFSDLNQASAHDYTKVLFGIDNVYRAGTIGTVAEKTAFGFVKGYLEDKNLIMRSAEIERIAMGCTGVKRTTGQHPGGIVVIPDYMDVFDFTPFQFPADDATSPWRTTHFDYHAIDEDVLKLDILGHSDPTQLRMIQDLTGMDITKVPLDDKETMGIFLSPEPLGVSTDQIMCPTGTLGIPEFGTPFTIGMLVDTKPKTFSELIKISGLSHGTDVWLGNAQELIRNKVVPFKNVIGCRDDIMVYLMYNGLEPIKAFKIMEFVRKGKASKDPDTWAGHVETMKNAGIEDWFIGSCGKIKYMFPKAHAAAYVISAFRIAWFKVHMPIIYYATYFSARITDYDIEVMMEGYNAIKEKMQEIGNKGYEATNKDSAVLETLKIALEATARGMKFAPIDLNKSEATTFVVVDDNTMIPPFSTIDGLGDTVAKTIVAEREKRPFFSIEDVQKRGKVSATLIEKMRAMGIFEGMDESSQLSLF